MSIRRMGIPSWLLTASGKLRGLEAITARQEDAQPGLYMMIPYRMRP